MTRPRHPPRDEQGCLETIFEGCPELAIVTAHVRAFADLMTERRGRDFEQ